MKIKSPLLSILCGTVVFAVGAREAVCEDTFEDKFDRPDTEWVSAAESALIGEGFRLYSGKYRIIDQTLEVDTEEQTSELVIDFPETQSGAESRFVLSVDFKALQPREDNAIGLIMNYSGDNLCAVRYRGSGGALQFHIRLDGEDKGGEKPLSEELVGNEWYRLTVSSAGGDSLHIKLATTGEEPRTIVESDYVLPVSPLPNGKCGLQFAGRGIFFDNLSLRTN